jgi:hypothetical protein
MMKFYPESFAHILESLNDLTPVSELCNINDFKVQILYAVLKSRQKIICLYLCLYTFV